MKIKVKNRTNCLYQAAIVPERGDVIEKLFFTSLNAIEAFIKAVKKRKEFAGGYYHSSSTTTPILSSTGFSKY